MRCFHIRNGGNDTSRWHIHVVCGCGTVVIKQPQVSESPRGHGGAQWYRWYTEGYGDRWGNGWEEKGYGEKSSRSDGNSKYPISYRSQRVDRHRPTNNIVALLEGLHGKGEVAPCRILRWPTGAFHQMNCVNWRSCTR